MAPELAIGKSVVSRETTTPRIRVTKCCPSMVSATRADRSWKLGSESPLMRSQMSRSKRPNRTGIVASAAWKRLSEPGDDQRSMTSRRNRNRARQELRKRERKHILVVHAPWSCLCEFTVSRVAYSRTDHRAKPGPRYFAPLALFRRDSHAARGPGIQGRATVVMPLTIFRRAKTGVLPSSASLLPLV